MGEANTLMKIVVCLGMIFLLAGLMYPGAQSGWNRFSSSTRNFPTFNNPFGENAISVRMYPVSNGWQFPSNVTGGTLAKYFEVLRSDDGERSYLTLNDSTYTVDVNLSAIQIDGIVTGFTFDISARSPVNETQFVTLYNDRTNVSNLALDLAVFPEIIPITSQFMIYHFQGTPTGAENVMKLSDISGLRFEFSKHLQSFPDVFSNATIDISFMQLTVFSTGISTCPTFGNWWEVGDNLIVVGCEIAQIGAIIVKIFQFLVNGILFIAALLGYLGGVITSFFGMLGFLFAIPGLPDGVQSFITIVVVALILWIAFVAFRAIRGSGAVG